MNNIRNIAILGSTGSIGRQTIDIIAEYPDKFRAWMLTCNNSASLLIEQALKMRPKCVVVANESKREQVNAALAGTGIKVYAGAKAMSELVQHPDVDTVVTALVGYSGLAPTFAAIESGKTIALANKETLVVAGELIMNMLKRSTSVIYPIDSEHGAFYQCLVGEKHKNISKLILTGSGGPFRTTPKESLSQITVSDALHHPRWTMGAKITIDSATMMNKGFEMIEAKWLYDVDAKDIEIVIHPQCIVHSMVEFVDGSVKAQLGLTDMHLPIRYALGLPDRLPSNARKMTLSDYATLTFEKPDFEKFPLLQVAYDAIAKQGNVPCVMNAANEIAVAAFLKDEINYLDIYNIITKTIGHISYVKSPTYDDYVASNEEARQYAATLV